MSLAFTKVVNTWQASKVFYWMDPYVGERALVGLARGAIVLRCHSRRIMSMLTHVLSGLRQRVVPSGR